MSAPRHIGPGQGDREASPPAYSGPLAVAHTLPGMSAGAFLRLHPDTNRPAGNYPGWRPWSPPITVPHGYRAGRPLTGASARAISSEPFGDGNALKTGGSNFPIFTRFTGLTSAPVNL